ncbi:transglutaminase-like domain-containing protein [Actinokineospora inagensis]|uniref:transglutaminase-like domain-containing protein n=1 Tax=Actinokineospora inagensis TaxID=103730 RepID=UPI0003F5A81E|nr:transglutaminase family protein [Actinokineospora inagensis]
MTTATALLAATDLLDHESDEVRRFVAAAVPDPSVSDRDKAVALFYAVRDGVFYEVYGADMSRDGLRASAVSVAKTGFCLHKSILYAAATRAVGIPSRVLAGEVRNHLASDKLKELVGGEVFLHWLNEIHLDGRWLKTTPVFNKMLCKLYGISPLEFDGTADAVYHPFDDKGRRHMEFVGAVASFDDVEHAAVIALMRERHPGMFASADAVHGGGSLVAEAPAAD